MSLDTLRPFLGAGCINVKQRCTLLAFFGNSTGRRLPVVDFSRALNRLICPFTLVVWPPRLRSTLTPLRCHKTTGSSYKRKTAVPRDFSRYHLPRQVFSAEIVDDTCMRDGEAVQSTIQRVPHLKRSACRNDDTTAVMKQQGDTRSRTSAQR
jgi:hypothetical protein